MTHSLEDIIELCKDRTHALFTLYLKNSKTHAPLLQKSMAYAVMNGGKSVRPLLVYATGYALDIPFENLDAAAASVEFIHAYSLIHDDLPAMDNADLRRGKLSCHKAFTEAVAILAGDALQALAFEIIASHPSSLNAEQRLKMITVLSHACGPAGMAAGQTLDITAAISAENIIQMYELKTGALLSASVKLGFLGKNTLDPITQSSLENYADYIGLAFQLQDDLLDIESDTQTLGKPQGLDAINNKKTYPACFGIEKTREKIQELFTLSIKSIQPLGEKNYILHDLATYLLQRQK